MMAAINDPYAVLREKVLRSVLEGPGESASSLRHAAADNAGVPADLQAVVDKIHRHAHRVTDDDIERLKPNYSEDQLFEIIVSAALGASQQRLAAGLNALRDA